MSKKTLAAMVDSVEEPEALENENIDKEPESGRKQKLLQRLATRMHRPLGHQILVVIFPQFLEVNQYLLHPQQPLQQVSHNHFRQA